VVKNGGVVGAPPGFSAANERGACVESGFLNKRTPFWSVGPSRPAVALPHNQVRRLMAEDFALHLGASAGHDWTDLDETLRTDTTADDSREALVHADMESPDHGMPPQLGEGAQVDGSNHHDRLYVARLVF
jgi:hypothetical protein